MLLIPKNTLQKAVLLSAIIVASAGYLNTHTTIQTNQAQTIKSVEKSLPTSTRKTATLFQQATKRAKPSLAKVKPPVYKQPEIARQEPLEVIQISYDEESLANEYWQEEEDEEAYMEQKRLAYESMTDEELAAKKQINEFEQQILMESNGYAQNPEIHTRLIALFTPENEQQNNPLVDLHCSASLCRVALDVVDESAQYDAMQSITTNIDDLQQQGVDIHIRADDSRAVTLYLAVLETSEFDQ